MPTKAVLVLSSPAMTLVAIEIEAEILGSLLRHRAGKQTPTEGLQNPLLRTSYLKRKFALSPLLSKFNHKQACFNKLTLTPKLFRKGENAKKVPRAGYTQTLILRPSPWKLWPGSLQSLGDARMHKFEPAGIKVSWSSRNQDQESLKANTAKSPGSALLPKPSVL